jgi:cytoskeletal protein RodZ
MSQTLGEKLRQAREEKGLSLANVAEQTRISSLYLEAIENDDYKILPGGIFNKGFIKSYAKFVGIDEQEALMDYQANLARSEGADSDEPKTYKPEVLTDDRSGSMLPTIIVAAIVLALMTGGILYLVKYLRSDSSAITSNTTKPPVSVANDTPNSNVSTEPSSTGVPDMASLAVDVKAGTQPVKIIATVDGEPAKPVNIAAGSSTTFNPKQSLTLNYLRWNSAVVSMSVNGKDIKLPAEPLDPKDKDRIVFTISPETLPQIWNSGAIGSVTAAASEPPPASETPVQKPAATSTPKPASTPVAKPPANVPAKPPANTAKPPTMMTTTKPSPKPNE